MQKPRDQMGLRGYKAAPGIHRVFYMTEFTVYLDQGSVSVLFTLQVLGSLFYAYYVFVRLCIPQFRSISLQIMDLRATVLCVFNSILPGKNDF